MRGLRNIHGRDWSMDQNWYRYRWKSKSSICSCSSDQWLIQSMEETKGAKIVFYILSKFFIWAKRSKIFAKNFRRSSRNISELLQLFQRSHEFLKLISHNSRTEKSDSQQRTSFLYEMQWKIHSYKTWKNVTKKLYFQEKKSRIKKSYFFTPHSMHYVAWWLIALWAIVLTVFSGMFLYAMYIVLFKTRKEYIKYGDRYVMRFRDKKTWKFI